MAIAKYVISILNRSIVRIQTRWGEASRLQLVLLPLLSRLLLLSALPDEAAALAALHATPDADALVEDEAPEDVGPGGVVGEVGVELAGDVVELVEAGPGDGGEVVVLVVQADVVRQEVEGPVVRVGLGHGDAVGRVGLRRRHRRIHVVLGDEVAGERVQAAGQERREHEVQQRLRAQRAQHHGVEGELGGDVEGRDPGEGHAVHGHGPQGVEEDLEGAEEGLAEDGVEEDGLEGGGQVGVEPVDAQRLVVGQVVGAEGGAVGDADGQVREDGEQAVRGGRAEGEVVADLVDGEEEVLVGGRADDVGQQPERGREEGRVAEQVGAEHLDRDDEEDDVFCQGFRAAELRYLGRSSLAKTRADGERVYVPLDAP